MLLVADIILTALHVAVVLFVLVGWAIPGLRRFHLGVISLTFLSWFVLGIRYGWGYCFLTDWAWKIKKERGITGLPDSFVKWALDSVTGFEWSAAFVDIVTVALGVLALMLSLYVNWRGRNE